MKKVALLHGAGYTGGELLRLLISHPEVELEMVTSRGHAGKPVWEAHPALRGQTNLTFAPDALSDLKGIDAVFIAAEHGKGAETVVQLLEHQYQGAVIDLSADFRFQDAGAYEEWFGFTHPAPGLLKHFQYGMPEVFAPYPAETNFIANPGCFATAITLALWPLVRNLDRVSAAVTALTGASGSGARAKETTHFPTRDGNVRVYKPFFHQHVPEVMQTLGSSAQLHFLPASGPWVRGIWGTAQVDVPEGVHTEDVMSWYQIAYSGSPFVRLYHGSFPEMRFSVNTPFCDIGWMLHGRKLAVCFAIDNLLKGAASQAIQNMNLILGLPETAGLLPGIVGRRALA